MFCILMRLCPSSPQPPSPTRGEGGSMGVLMPETGDGTQGLSKNPPPFPISHAWEMGNGGVLMPETGDIKQYDNYRRLSWHFSIEPSENNSFL